MLSIIGYIAFGFLLCLMLVAWVAFGRVCAGIEQGHAWVDLRYGQGEPTVTFIYRDGSRVVYAVDKEGGWHEQE